MAGPWNYILYIFYYWPSLIKYKLYKNIKYKGFIIYYLEL